MATIRERAMQGNTRARGTVKTTNGTVTDLNPNGGILTLANNTALFVSVDVVANRKDGLGESAAYTLTAVVDRGANAASTALVGSVTKTVVGEDTAAWDANLVVDTTAGGVKVQVTGEASKQITWTARFKYVQA